MGNFFANMIKLNLWKMRNSEERAVKNKNAGSVNAVDSVE